MTRWWPWLAALVAGLLLGGIAGRVSFARLDDPRATCGTCHHGQTRLGEPVASGEAPHRTSLGTGCHRCHVVPVGAYVGALASQLGASPPSWAATMADPAVGGQTCLGCHIGRGRGGVDCDRCHVDGLVRPFLQTGCPACHSEAPMHPHDDQPCTGCHVEAALGHRARTEVLMRAKLEGTDDRRER